MNFDFMCRLYGFRASEPTKVECTLIHAQNALMVQSRRDLAGYSHAQGWGVATYENHHPHVERQAWAAYHGEHFQRAAARIYSKAVLAHVRRATVGPAALENTHPFWEGTWALIHNGTIPNFDQVEEPMLEAMTDKHRRAINGVTDSEFFFRLLLSTRDARPEDSLKEILHTCINQVVIWCHDVDPAAPIGLNVIVTDGIDLVGTRLGRGLYYLERDGVYDCEICHFPHIHHDPSKSYRAAVVASEPITHESWIEVPEGSIYSVGPDYRFHIEPLLPATNASSSPPQLMAEME